MYKTNLTNLTTLVYKHRRSRDFVWTEHFFVSKKLTTFLVVTLKTQAKLLHQPLPPSKFPTPS